VKVISETDYSIRCEVTSSSPHEVILKYENFSLILICNCIHNANKPNDLCSHKIAALTYLTNNPNMQIESSIETIIPTKPMEDIYGKD